MRLEGKKLLMLITDGVEESEFDILRDGFLQEGAQILVATPQAYLTVTTVRKGKPGREIVADLPVAGVDQADFDGLIIPDGILSVELLRQDAQVTNLVFMFHQQKLPIFASGTAVQILYDSQVLSQQILIREGTPFGAFLNQAVDILLECVPKNQLYRPMMYW